MEIRGQQGTQPLGCFLGDADTRTLQNPMPDLKTRAQRERETAAAVLLIFQQYGQDALHAWPGPYDWAIMQARLQAALTPTLAETFEQAAAQIKAKYGVQISEPELRRWAEQWANGYAGPLSTAIVGTTQADLDALKGKTQAEVAAAFAVIVAGMAARAEMIAITETTRAISAGEGFMVERGGLIGAEGVELLWQTAEDERVCDVCGPLHGAGYEIYDRVSPGGPPAHPRCRCFLSPPEDFS